VGDQKSSAGKYPLLEALLEERGLSLKGTYTYRDTTEIFNCSIRGLQDRIRSGELKKRNLPGRAKFLSVDLENFLENSLEKAPKRRNEECG
jgi:hypothetical protein